MDEDSVPSSGYATGSCSDNPQKDTESIKEAAKVAEVNFNVDDHSIEEQTL